MQINCITAFRNEQPLYPPYSPSTHTCKTFNSHSFLPLHYCVTVRKLEFLQILCKGKTPYKNLMWVNVTILFHTLLDNRKFMRLTQDKSIRFYLFNVWWNHMSDGDICSVAAQCRVHQSTSITRACAKALTYKCNLTAMVEKEYCSKCRMRLG